MNTEIPPPSTSRWFVAGRLIGATLICLLILAITIPNLGRIERSTHTTSYGWPDAVCIFIIVAPLILIFLGAARSVATEYAGWTLLLVLLVLRFVA